MQSWHHVQRIQTSFVVILTDDVLHHVAEQHGLRPLRPPGLRGRVRVSLLHPAVAVVHRVHAEEEEEEEEEERFHNSWTVSSVWKRSPICCGTFAVTIDHLVA